MQSIGKAAAIAWLTIGTGLSAWANEGGASGAVSERRRWELSLGIGETKHFPSGTHVPQFRFSTVSLEYKDYIWRNASLGYQFSVADQMTEGKNSAASVSLIYTRYVPISGRLSACCKAGLGIIELQDFVSGQATRTNFREQLGVGVEYATGPGSAIAIGYTFSHASNAGIEGPNHGINSKCFTFGYVFRR